MQQQALSPLASQWDALSDGQKRKWLALAQNYNKLAPAEQEKMHSRMVEWASLSAKDREQARLNFAKTKTVPGAERASNWEAYQALSEEEKKKLAASAAAHPAGAAVAAKPVPQDKLAIIPVPRSNAATPKNSTAKAPASGASAPKPADASPGKAP